MSLTYDQLRRHIDDATPIGIIFWADNTWEYLEDYRPENYAHMSDDTAIMWVSADMGADQIESLVQAYNRGEAGPWTVS